MRQLDIILDTGYRIQDTERIKDTEYWIHNKGYRIKDTE